MQGKTMSFGVFKAKTQDLLKICKAWFLGLLVVGGRVAFPSKIL